eukprot:365227-Chlamydomonas_euryale.AAC.9
MYAYLEWLREQDVLVKMPGTAGAAATAAAGGDTRCQNAGGDGSCGGDSSGDVEDCPPEGGGGNSGRGVRTAAASRGFPQLPAAASYSCFPQLLHSFPHLHPTAAAASYSSSTASPQQHHYSSTHVCCTRRRNPNAHSLPRTTLLPSHFFRPCNLQSSAAKPRSLQRAP